jgi:hypothetical protein
VDGRAGVIGGRLLSHSQRACCRATSLRAMLCSAATLLGLGCCRRTPACLRAPPPNGSGTAGQSKEISAASAEVSAEVPHGPCNALLPDAGLQMLGRIDEKFVEVVDVYEPLEDGRRWVT